MERLLITKHFICLFIAELLFGAWVTYLKRKKNPFIAYRLLLSYYFVIILLFIIVLLLLIIFKISLSVGFFVNSKIRTPPFIRLVK